MINILDPIPLINEDEWSSWTSLKNEYRNSYRKIARFSNQERNKRQRCKATLEVASNMKSELRETIKELEKRCLYEYNTMSQQDINYCKLTERQRQIAELRQNNSITEISKILEIDPSTVYLTYKEALCKIDKYLALKQEDRLINNLSEQQRRIYLMKKQGCLDREIAEEVGITINSLKTQKRRIKEKLGVTKL